MLPEDVEAAAARLTGVAVQSPLQRNDRLSALTGADIWLKREDLQPVRSYKLRGAYNFLAQLTPEQRAAGVVCASAGNHAQGVALGCHLLGIKGSTFLPRTTPRQKRDRIAALGQGQIDIRAVGDSYDEANAEAAAFAESIGAPLVPAFDAVDTIAGQGTVTRELIGQLGRVPDVLVVPVGGGGLLAGTIAWLAGESAAPRLVGVEPAGAASMAAAVAAGRPVPLDSLDTFVDGAAVWQVGELTYDLVRGSDVELVTVPEGAICSEMIELYQSDGIIAEPAGALAITALAGLSDLAGATVVAVVSGGNNDLSRYPEIIERALVHQGLKHYFLVEFPQEPGALRSFLDHALGPDDDITLFEYTKRNNRETGPALVGIELAHREDLDGLLHRLADLPLNVERVQPDHALFRFLI
ncbi:MAG TPA: threonine ammonia-lyase IlvA [Mycobacteriales bacterium]|nr:threonine ammonia-lyase IlvA [Mycobacteriales bacterium]